MRRVFDFHFTGQKKAHRVEQRLPNKVKMDRGCDPRVGQEWLLLRALHGVPARLWGRRRQHVCRGGTHGAAVVAATARGRDHGNGGAAHHQRRAMRGRPRLSMRSQAEVQNRPPALTDLQRIVAGTDVLSRQSDGTTIAMQYAREGISLKPANTDRINGWAEVMRCFGEVSATPGNQVMVRPTLFIHARCQRLLETLPALQHDPNRPEDVLKVDADEEGVGGDDAADALRYLVGTKSRTVAQTGSSCYRPTRTRSYRALNSLPMSCGRTVP